jgi:hypothetical protein
LAWRRRRGSESLRNGQLRKRCFWRGCDQRRFRNRVTWLESELFDEVIEREQRRFVEGWLLDRRIGLRWRRRRSSGLALDFPAAVPADRQRPVFERLLTVGTTLHNSSRTASAAAG